MSVVEAPLPLAVEASANVPRARRPLSLFERALYCYGGLPCNVTITASIEGQLDEATLRRALAGLQAKHPLLRSVIVDREGRPWFEEQASPLPLGLQIVERHSDDDWIELSNRELSHRFDAEREPMVRVTWLRGETRSELVFISHHSICDGRSVVGLMEELLKLCGDPDLSIGRYDKLETLEQLLPADLRADPKLRRGLGLRAALIRFVLRLVAWRKRPAVQYGEVYRDLWNLDGEQAQQLIERCRARDVNVYSVLSLAFVLAFRAVCGPQKIKHFIAPVDIRRFAPAIKSDALFSIAPTVTLRPPKPEANEPDVDAFWAQAKTMQTELRAEIERMPRKMFRTMLGLEYLHDIFDTMVRYGQTQRTGNSLTLSYVGRLPMAEAYNGFRLRAVGFISGLLGLTPAHLLVFSRFGDRFDFALASDDMSLPRDQARAIREKAMSLVEKMCKP